MTATITLEVEAASEQAAHNALVVFTEYGRLFDQLPAAGARCVRWDGVRVAEPAEKKPTTRKQKKAAKGAE